MLLKQSVMDGFCPPLPPGEGLGEGSGIDPVWDRFHRPLFVFDQDAIVEIEASQIDFDAVAGRL